MVAVLVLSEQQMLQIVRSCVETKFTSRFGTLIAVILGSTGVSCPLFLEANCAWMSFN